MTNCITSRSCLLIFLAAVRAVWTAIEQPMTSSLRHIPYFSYLQVLLQLCGNHTWKYCSLCLSCQFEFAVVDVTVYCMYVYLCTHQLSWLGLYGHSNAKPAIASGQRPCLNCCSPAIVLEGRCKLNWELRKWMGKLANRMSASRRKEFSAAAAKVVKRTKRKDGSVCVSRPQANQDSTALPSTLKAIYIYTYDIIYIYI